MSSLLLILLSAVLVNVAALTGAVAWRPFVGVTSAFEGARALAFVSLGLVPLVAVGAWMLSHYVLAPLDLDYLRTLAFVAILLIVVLSVEIALRRHGRLHPQRPGFALLMSTNAAALGVALVTEQRMRTLFDAVALSIAAALALGLLLLAFAAMHERLRAANVPAVFRDAPLALVSAGLMALGFMGFSGLIQE